MPTLRNPVCPRCHEPFSPRISYCLNDGTPLSLAIVRPHLGYAPYPPNLWKEKQVTSWWSARPVFAGKPSSKPVHIEEISRSPRFALNHARLRAFKKELRYRFDFRAVQDHGVQAWLCNNAQASYMVKWENGYVLRVYPLTQDGLDAMRQREKYVGKNAFSPCDTLDELVQLVESTDYTIIDANRPKPRGKKPGVIITFD